MEDWTEKYRPTTLAEVRGNDASRDEVREWATTWTDHREAAIVHGSPGVGKTSTAHALANDLGWDVIELNASDERTADVIERIAGRAAKNRSLGGAVAGGDDAGRQLIVLDEADNIHHQKDYGGQQAVADIVKGANQPILLVANDLYDMSRSLRNAGRQIEFRDVSARSIVPVLRDICRREGVEYEASALEAIAERNSGDLRSAINDLQAVAEANETLTVDDLVTGARDRSADIWTFLDAVLKDEPPEAALRTAYAVDETPDSLVKWVEDKVPKVYEAGELADAYEFLAAADTWLGRVRATQNYSYWRYVTDDLAAGVAAVRDHDRGGWTRYGGPPFRSRSDKTRDYVSRRIAERAGVSITTARRAVLPFLAAMTHHCRDRELTVAMAAAYDLGAEHVAYVTGSGKDTKKVQSIVEDANERREAEMVAHSGTGFEGAVRSGVDRAGPTDDEDDDGQTELVQAVAAEDGADEAVDGEADDGQSGLDEFL